MKVSGIDAIYYTVKDVAGETAFYTGLFGQEPAMTWEGRLSEWTFADGNSFGLYGAESAAESGGGHNGSAMFAVDDVAQAVSNAKARGVKFHDDGEITDTPACHMAFGEDPEGNQFILHYRKSQ
ncbi:MAG: VOC family protein [Candidatus Eremiobacteraeota bacterium]|nr:VOC family protein [Candidatus Eremiobacteraeota bacterium]